MKILVLVMILLTSCSHERISKPNYHVEIKNKYFVRELREIIKKQNLQSNNTIIRVVMLETITKQYMYVSPTHFSPNYEYFQPEGWLLIDNTLVVICQNGDLYGRDLSVQKEIENITKMLAIKLTNDSRAIVEPSGKRFIYCIQSKSMTSDDVFDKISDDECE